MAEQETPLPGSTDPLFQQGLQSILAPLIARGASQQEIDDLTKKAYSFYLNSQAASQPSPQAPVPSTSPSSEHQILHEPPEDAVAPPPTASASSDEPPYPLSFAALAQLIATGQPIPGIKEIPDKLTEEQPTVSTQQARRKPWEKDSHANETVEGLPLAPAEEGSGQV
ncbi:hypothetical protein T439DRAFT_168228 [Meredithblackwellia eburnea MCA 4105]